MSVDLARIIVFVRRRGGATRLEISTETGMGRAAVIQRLNHLTAAGMLVEGPAGPSTGGRAPRPYLFAVDRGRLLTAAVGYSGFAVGISDLGGTLIASEYASLNFGLGPDTVLPAIEATWRRLLDKCAVPAEMLWGAGLGLPVSVDFDAGRPLPTGGMPDWEGYDVAGRMEETFKVPCWVDNDANVMALGESRAGAARGVADVIVIKVATLVRAGLISGGTLHRGSRGVGGRLGESAGGEHLRRQGTAAAKDGSSLYLQSLLADNGDVDYPEVLAGAAAGDAVCARLVDQAGSRLGDTVSSLVDFLNPEIVVLGGGVAQSSRQVVTRIRESIEAHSSPAAVHGLRVVVSTLGRDAGLIGAAHLAAEELLSPTCFPEWFTPADPRARPALAAIRQAFPRDHES